MSSIPEVREVSPAPVTGNTGVVTANVDWLQFTLHGDLTVMDAVNLFGKDWEWSAMDRGYYGYSAGLQCGDVRIYHSGAEGMGTHVELTGSGCRQAVDAGAVTEWAGWLTGVLDMGAKVSRMDVCMDDRAGHLNVDRAVECLKDGCLVSRSRSFEVVGSGLISDPGEVGTTLYLGSSKSDTRIRMYDKQIEQLRKTAVDCGHWVRVEIQARRNKAQELALCVARGGVAVISNVLAGLADFKVRGTHSQKERWARCEWWNAFLAGVSDVLRLTVSQAPRTLATVHQWIERSVSGALAVMYRSNPDHFVTLCQEFVTEGLHKFRRGSWHGRVLADVGV